MQPYSHAALPAMIACILVCNLATAQRVRPLDPLAKRLQPDRMVTYKTAGGRDLKLHVFEPDGHRSTDRRSVFLIIHGGGWTGGYPWRCYPFADYFRRQGILAISIDYRLLNEATGTTVFDCVRDGRSAVRYVRQHADELGVNPQKIVVAGCSAGGHIAAGTALFNGVDHRSGDADVSCVPNALVLYYPVIDTSANGYGQKKIGAAWRQLSPVHHVRSGLPPTIVFHGTADTVTPYAGAKLFTERMRSVGNDCELVSEEAGNHGYFIFDLASFDQVMARTQRFLRDRSFAAVPQAQPLQSRP